MPWRLCSNAATVGTARANHRRLSELSEYEFQHAPLRDEGLLDAYIRRLTL
jgi:hypothetical protein